MSWLIVFFLFQVKEVFNFIFILLIVVVAYSVSSYSIRYDKTPVGFYMLGQVFRTGYWGLYGELFLENGM